MRLFFGCGPRPRCDYPLIFLPANRLIAAFIKARYNPARFIKQNFVRDYACFQGEEMKTYQQIFTELKRPALVPFFVLGDPDEERSFGYIKAAIDAGADILELGVAFSDPIADGPTIQAADMRALAAGVTVDKALRLVRRVKDYRDIPIGLLMYYNLIEHHGRERFYAAAAAAGVNSVLVADLCVDDAEEVAGLARQNGLDMVFMVTPNTTGARRAQILRLCSGFVYTVSVVGVTGARRDLSAEIGPLIGALKAETRAPVCVGFGVSRPEHARALAAAGADGVIVGSAVVEIIARNLQDQARGIMEMTAYIRQMRQALENKSFPLQDRFNRK